MQKENICITKENITAENIALLCEKLSKLECTAYVEINNQRINARSLMGMIAFKFVKGQSIAILTDGSEQEKAAALIKGIFVE